MAGFTCGEMLLHLTMLEGVVVFLLHFQLASKLTQVLLGDKGCDQALHLFAPAYAPPAPDGLNVARSCFVKCWTKASYNGRKRPNIVSWIKCKIFWDSIILVCCKRPQPPTANNLRAVGCDCGGETGPPASKMGLLSYQLGSLYYPTRGKERWPVQEACDAVWSFTTFGKKWS